MKLRLHHIELCVKDPEPIIQLLCNQLGLNLVGHRESQKCLQYVLKLAKTVFIVTSRKGSLYYSRNNNNFDWFTTTKNDDDDSHLLHRNLSQDENEHWTLFCCKEDKGEDHIDSVFNVAVEVKNLTESLKRVRESGARIVQKTCRVYDTEDYGYVDFAIIKSCCGNVVHTLIQKTNFRGWFLPGFNQLVSRMESHINGITMSHFDHFTLACRVGETDDIIEWYENAFGMKRFLTNSKDTEDDGLVIGDDVGLRLKVMQFWKCSEAGLASQNFDDGDWEPLKIVIAESLPNISNTQIESFIKDHGSPGIQHVGLHTENMVQTVRELTKHGVRFRHPPPTYYTEIGQLNVIKSVGEDVETLRKYGILLDNEADVFDTIHNPKHEQFLMQVFTYPVFDKDTFFLEVIQRRGARGFGIGNVTALARSVNAYQKMQQESKQSSTLLKSNANAIENRNLPYDKS